MPRFEHDCTGCIYQGILGKYDAYYCPDQVGGPTMVYRWATDNEVDGYGLYISQSLTKVSRDPRVNGMFRNEFPNVGKKEVTP
jgi:hypothetical protein